MPTPTDEPPIDSVDPRVAASAGPIAPMVPIDSDVTCEHDVLPWWECRICCADLEDADDG